MNQNQSKRSLARLLLMFFASGCAALIYEIVWLQLLELVIGSSGYSIAVLLGTFMGGMCLGSLLLPRLIPPRFHPLRVYALLEIGTGLLGIAVLYGMPYLADLYAALYWHGVASRALVSALCLVPPTLLMGATLPAASRFVESTPEGISWMGYFYGGNIAGGVIGCLGAGFLFLRLFDMPTAAFVAAAMNLSAAALGIWLARRTVHNISFTADAAMSPITSSREILVHLTIAASGMSALGAEVVWTRLLSLLLGGTVYTFSIILAVFLAGLGIGTSIGSLLARTSRNPRAALGCCQLSLAGAIAWAAFIIARSLPYWPINPGIYTSDWGPWHLFQLDIVRVGWAVLPATILWGASFPLAIAGVASRGQDPGRMVGGIYAANTIGAIVGSLAFSLIVIPRVGTQWGERLMIMTAAFAALLALASAFSLRMPRVTTEGEALRPNPSFRAIVAVLVALICIVFLISTVAKIPWVVVAWGRFSATYIAQTYPDLIDEKASPPDHSSSSSRWYCTYVGEGINVSVAVTKTGAGYRFFHGAGKVQASSQPQDMRLQRMLGHLSILAARDPEKVSDVLVVACGAGVTAGSFVLYPDVKKITVCDIEPLVPKVVAPMFGEENYHIADGIDRQNPHFVNGKHVTMIYDDGRHYIRTLPRDEKFDVITSDPIDPWVKGSAALNTVEYYEMCKSHLKPGGVMTLWMPLYESNVDSAKSMIATFFQIFPRGMIFSNDQHFEGYDAVLLGQVEPARIDLNKLESMLNREDYGQVRESLVEVGFGRASYEGDDQSVVLDLMSTFAGQASDLTKWMKNAQINRDRNLRLQYLSGMWFNSYLGTTILENILDSYRFPTNVFVGSQERLSILKSSLAAQGRREK